MLWGGLTSIHHSKKTLKYAEVKQTSFVADFKLLILLPKKDNSEGVGNFVFQMPSANHLMQKKNKKKKTRQKQF